MDRLAKLGTQENPVSRVVGILFAAEKEVIKSWLERRYLSSWKRAKNCRWSKKLMKCLQPNRAKDLLAIKRNKLRIGIGLFTGHVSQESLVQTRACRACAGRKARTAFTFCATALHSLAKNIDFGVVCFSNLKI